MTRGAVSALVGKELRELGPLWLVTMVGLTLIGVSDVVTPALLYAVPAAVLASLAPLALGAMIIGHEYRHRTTATLLTLPIGRGPGLAVKAAVLGGLMGLVGAAAWWVGARTPWLWLPLACGFFLAPWFTLLMRSELAGMVFACAVPVAFLVAGEIVASIAVPSDPDFLPVANLVRAWIVGGGTAVVCAVALVDTVGRFRRLESVESGLRRSGSARLTAGAAALRRPQGRWTALVRKELRLQTLPVILGVGLAAANVLVATFLEGSGPGLVERTATVLRPLLAVLLALLIGSIASSEERQLGVWSSQVLTPVALWKQWGIKVAVVLGLAVGFGLALSGFEVVNWRLSYWLVPAFAIPAMAAPASLLALYVSSLSRRSLTALMVSVGLLAACLFESIWLARIGWRISYNAHVVVAEALSPGDVSVGFAIAVDSVVGLLSWVAPFLVGMYFAMLNHRRVDFSPRRLASQAAVLAAVVTMSVVVSAGSEGAKGAVISEAARHARTVR